MTSGMDNFHIDVTSRGVDGLRKALSLMTEKVVGYSVDPVKGMILYWKNTANSTALPYHMTMEQAADMVWGWLATVPYGDKPDLDGSCSKGWRVYCERYGRINDDFYAFVAVQPVWAEHHK